MAQEYTLAELMICAASEAWRNDGEVLATGIGTLPRLAASLSMLSTNPDLMMTDSEAFLLSAPNPIGARAADFKPAYETWMGFSRIFDNVWGGKRHAMVGPTQLDRFGQANISCIGDYAKPKSMMLGVRGYPGNSISHANSFFVPSAAETKSATRFGRSSSHAATTASQRFTSAISEVKASREVSKLVRTPISSLAASWCRSRAIS